MTITMVGLSADATTARVLVTHLGEPSAATIEVVDGDGSLVTSQPITSWRTSPVRSKPSRPDHSLHWVKATLTDLEPGRRYQLHLIEPTRRLPLANAAVTTTPGPGTDHVRLAAGSCFDVNGKHAKVLATAYRELTDQDLAPQADPVPTYNLWLGDQVYVDAPWLETTTTAHIRRVIFDRYLRTWGLTEPSSAFAQVMRQTSNWFLPDDHEFWNGYPNPSWLTLFWHTAKRFALQLWRLPQPGPPHPSAQGQWGATAGEAYALFASPIEFDTFDEQASPPQLQVIETDHLVVAMVDQRWHRTIRRIGPGAGFMRGEDLDDLLDLLRREDRLVVLGLSRPMIGFLPHRGVTQRKVEYGPEDYSAQYTALWQALAERRRAGRPTISVAGDVHRHAVRSADDDGLLEIISSPLSLLGALDHDSGLNRARRRWVAVRSRMHGAWLGTKTWLRVREEAMRPSLVVNDANAYPAFDLEGSWRSNTGRALFEDGEEASGVAAIDIRSDPAGHTVTVSYVLGRVTNARVAGSRVDGARVDAARSVRTRREDRAFRWTNTDPADPLTRPAWHKL